MIDPADSGKLAQDVGRRLAVTRRCVGVNQQDFGRQAGLTQPRYNQYETGQRLLTLAAAMRLCEEYGLTLDWLYRGDPSGLPYWLASSIRELRSADKGQSSS